MVMCGCRWAVGDGWVMGALDTEQRRALESRWWVDCGACCEVSSRRISAVRCGGGCGALRCHCSGFGLAVVVVQLLGGAWWCTHLAPPRAPRPHRLQPTLAPHLPTSPSSTNTNPTTSTTTHTTHHHHPLTHHQQLSPLTHPCELRSGSAHTVDRKRRLSPAIVGYSKHDTRYCRLLQNTAPAIVGYCRLFPKTAPATVGNCKSGTRYCRL